MMHIFKDTLLPSALFALVQYLGCVVLMPRAGAWIDEAYRLPLMRAAIAVENVCVLLTCVTLASMVLRQGPGAGGKVDGAFAASFGALLVLGIAGEVMNQVQTIALENDWIVVMTTGKHKSVLPKLNVILRRIDLLCKVLAPGVIGLFLDYFSDDDRASSLLGLLVLAIWNAMSWPIEYMMLYEVYFRTPSLHRKPVEVQGCEEGCVPSGGLRPQDCAEDCALGEFYGRMGAADTHAHAHAHGHAHGHAHAGAGANGGGAGGGNGGRRVGGSKTLGAIRAYVGHDVFLASLSFCLLFMTVLDNGTLITSYFTWRDIHASVLGLQRGVGAACGLAGTFAFMALLSWGMDEKRVGLFSIWFFAACMVS